MTAKKYLFLFLIPLALIICLIPYFLETSWGKAWISGVASKNIHADLKINDAEFSWLGPQVLKNVTINDSSRGSAKIGTVTIGDSLFSLAWSRRPTKVTVENLEGIWGNNPPIRAGNVFLSWDAGSRALSMKGVTFYGSEQGSISIHVGQFDPSDLMAISQLQVDVQRLPVGLIEYLGRYVGVNFPFKTILGNSLDVNLKQKNQDIFTLYLVSPLAKAHGDVRYDGKSFKAVTPLELTWNNQSVQLQGEYSLATSKGRVEIPNLPLSLLEMVKPGIGRFLRGKLNAVVDFDLSQSDVIVEGSITSDNFPGAPLRIKATIPKGERPSVHFELGANAASFNLSSKGIVEPTQDNLVAHLDAEVSFRDFPFENYVSDDIYALIGNKNNVDLKVKYSKAQNGLVQLAMQGQHVNAEIDLALDSHLRLQNAGKEAVVHAKIPPQLCKTLLANTPLSDINWTAPIPISLTIDHLQIPPEALFGGDSSQLIASTINQGVQGKISIGPLETFVPETRKKLLLGLIEGAVTMEGGKRLRLSLNTHGGSMNLQMNGVIGLSADDPIDVTFNGSDIPSEFVALLARLDQTMSSTVNAIFGGLIDVNGRAALVNGNGDLALSLTSPSAKTTFNGRLQNGFLLLNQPLQLQAAMTPELVRNLLAPKISLLSGLVSAEGPLFLSIDPQGFALPLNPFDIQRLTLRSGVIRVGTLGFAPGSDLGSLLSVLTPLPNGPIMVQSTPLYFSMERGVLSLNRWDMLLAQTLPVACWGSVDFARQWVDLVLGLTPRAVEVAFNVPGLNDSHMLQIPIRGPLGNVSIDRRGVAAQLTSLVARSRKGPEGLLIGTFLQFTGGWMKDQPAPPPTTQPLPWETASSRPASSPVADAVTEGLSAPVDVLQKGADSLQRGANNLLNQIFR